MGISYYFLSGVWGIAMVTIFILAIRLSYCVEARSPDLRNTTGLPRKAMFVHTAFNRKVARDPETQVLRRRMNVFFLLNLLGFALIWIWLGLSGTVEV